MKRVKITPKYFEVIVSTYFYEYLQSFATFERAKKSEELLFTFATSLRTFPKDFIRTSMLALSAVSLSRDPLSVRCGRAGWLAVFGEITTELMEFCLLQKKYFEIRPI